MRTAHVLFAGVIAGALTAPVLAKSSNTHDAEEKSSASTCTPYQQAPDGSWKESGERDKSDPDAAQAGDQGRSRKRAEPTPRQFSSGAAPS
jgi:hypothetical protein